MKNFGGHFDIPRLQQTVLELDEKMLESDFWDDNDKAQNILRHSKNLKKKISRFNSLVSDLEEIEVMLEMCDEEPSMS